MNKIISRVLALVLVCGAFSINAFAAETPVESEGIKTVVVDMNDVMSYRSSRSSKTETLSKHMASRRGTGIVESPGEIVDLSRAVPAGSKIVSISMYCPTRVKVTQSTYTTINNWSVESPVGEFTIPFVRTNSPTYKCKNTELAGLSANTKFYVTVEGKVLQNRTGFDGFTVFGGAKMIIEYR